MYRKLHESIRISKLLSWRLAVFPLGCATALAALFVPSLFVRAACTAKTGCPTNPKASSNDMRGIAIRQISGPPLIGTGACPGKANKCK